MNTKREHMQQQQQQQQLLRDAVRTHFFFELRFNMASLFSFLQSETTPRVTSASNSRLDTSSSSPVPTSTDIVQISSDVSCHAVIYHVGMQLNPIHTADADATQLDSSRQRPRCVLGFSVGAYRISQRGSGSSAQLFSLHYALLPVNPADSVPVLPLLVRLLNLHRGSCDHSAACKLSHHRVHAGPFAKRI